MEEVDRYMLARYAEVARRILKAYDDYDYPTIFQTLNAFMSVDLSAVYSDISKDRLYTFAAGSRERRSAQTAMYVMTDGFARLVAPILPVTAEQLWMHMPGNATREESVHLALFPAATEIDALDDRTVLDTWEHLLRVRTTVNAALEMLRKEKQIGTSLEAHVRIIASGSDFDLLQRYDKQLPMLFIVSSVALERSTAPADGQKPDLAVHVTRASGAKCERCWRYVSSMSTNPAQTGICDRCQDALSESASS
jgi:isoleucyl-tRNA synthetase